MGGPDTSGIDLNPANFRGRADLVYCLDQLYTKIGRPTYRDLRRIGQSRGIELSTSTIGDLIGKNSKTNPNKLTWKTVELFVLACGVPETELDRWRAAWEAAMAPEMPTWPEEQQHLFTEIDQLKAALAVSEARIDQLAADAQKAEARAVDCEKTLADRDQTQSAEPSLSEHDLEVLHLKATARRNAGDYAGAEELYEQIAKQLEYKLGPGNRRTLRFKSLHLDAKTCEFTRSWRMGIHVSFTLEPRIGELDKRRWEELVCEHQRWLPEGDPMTLRLRLRQAYWADVMWSHPLARRYLNDLHADCKAFLSSDDPLTAEVARRMKNGFLVKTQGTQKPDDISFFDDF
ncbi:MAG TPA: hypothetical protein VJT72_15120 [Pseudonocardiaceae bacterium]|nr:hypothetical protein [Pseudonocardiaceae bacterium]